MHRTEAAAAAAFWCQNETMSMASEIPLVDCRQGVGILSPGKGFCPDAIMQIRK